MSGFEGFREGCPGLFRHEVSPGPGGAGSTYVKSYVQFQAGGKKLQEWDAGVKRPDAIRVVPVDDYEAPVWQDRVYAFDEEVAEAQRQLGDGQVAADKIFTLEAPQLDKLNRACTDCRANGRQCPALAALMDMVLSDEVQH